MSRILVKRGEYRGIPVNDTPFTLVKGFHTGKKGSYVTVKNESHFDVDIAAIKIKVKHISDIEFLTSEEQQHEHEPVVEETEEEAMDRIAERFRILDEMSGACINGDIRSMIVSGPPGVGKSFGVEQQLEKASIFDKITNKKIRFEVVKGAMTALGLYAQLFRYSDKKNVLVFDDCDTVLLDDLSLNILKAALDSGKRRRICWNSDSRLLRDEGIPNSFDFKGSVIFITNLKFENVRSKKLQDHLEALESRSHFLDLTIDSEKDKMLRIKQVHRDADGGLFKDYNFNSDEDAQILEFMQTNQRKLREMSIRMALKLADLVKISPTNWKSLAVSTCMRRT